RTWVGGKGWNLYRSSDTSLRHYAYNLPEKDYTSQVRGNSTEAMLEEQPDIFWVVSNFGLYRFNAATGDIRRFLFSEGMPSLKAANLFTEGVIDKHRGLIWLGTWAGGLVSFDYRKQVFRQYRFSSTPTDIANRNVITDILPKSSDELWIASPDAGLGVFRISTGTFEFYRSSTADALPASGVTFLHKDKQQNLWVSTNQGIYKLSARNAYFTSRELPNIRRSDPYHQVVSLLKDTAEKKLYLGLDVGDGLYIYDYVTGNFTKTGCEPCRKDPGYSLVIHNMLKDSRGIIWMTSSKGIYRYLPDKNKLVKEAALAGSLSDDFYTVSIYEDSRGYLYFSSRWNGIYRYHPVSGKTDHYTAEPSSPVKLHSNRVIDMIEYKPGVLMVMGGDKLPYLLDLNKGETKEIKTSQPVDDLNSFETVLRDGQGRFWIGTYRSGLACYTDKGDSFSVKRFFVDGGTPTHRISQMIMEGDHTLVMGTDMGLLLFDTRTGRERLFTARDGLKEDEVWQSLYQAPDGEIILGRNGSFTSFFTSQLVPDTVPPSIVMTSLKVLDKEWIDSINPNFTKQLTLSHDQNLIGIEFASLNFINTESNRYAYKLEGIDRDWVYSGSRRYVSYGALPPGRYTLKIRAANGDGLWTPEPYSLSITIRPPFWQTTLFYLLVACLSLGAIYAFHRYRIRQIEEREKIKTSLQRQLAQVEMKALRAQMNPHFIFNCLNSINGYIAHNEQKEASIYLARFSKLIRMILENAQHDFIPLESELATLSAYLEIEAVRFQNRFSWHLDVDEGISVSSLLIPSMVIQPYIENAIWHGLMHQPQKGDLHIRFVQTDEGLLQVTIEDNGIGREKSKQLASKTALKDKSYGMKITSERIQLLNETLSAKASFEVEDLYDDNGEACGTRIRLQLPVKSITKEWV
ncbi:MAG TPA: histidine kinase, partial [Flavisolibacter sp.]|nr:histidine kinase [Flavisolibacter sp.]